MNPKVREMWRAQLDRTLAPWRAVAQDSAPSGGWIRAIRTNLGMTREVLAKRLGFTPSSLADLERSEAQGTITLKSLRKVAEAMDCDVVYALVPRAPLDDLLRAKAVEKANGVLRGVSHTMKLEAQEVAHSQAQTEALVERLLENPKALWK